MKANEWIQVAEIEREASVELAEDMDYRQMEGLSEECAEKLCEVRPLNLAAASRFVIKWFKLKIS